MLLVSYKTSCYLHQVLQAPPRLPSVDRFGGNDGGMKCCPLCRSDRAYTYTCMVKKLQELLTIIASLVGGTSVTDSDREESSLQ